MSLLVAPAPRPARRCTGGDAHAATLLTHHAHSRPVARSRVTLAAAQAT